MIARNADVAHTDKKSDNRSITGIARNGETISRPGTIAESVEPEGSLRDHHAEKSDARSAKNQGGAGLLVVNAKFAHTPPFSAISPGGMSDSATPHKKPVSGLVRVKLAARGAKLEDFGKDEFQVYKRLLRWQRLRAVQHILSGERVSKCYRVRFKDHVQIWRSRSAKKAHYKNLVVCASVWACPVCAAKITERRKIELETAPRLNDFSKFMVTYTLQHNRGDRLDELSRDLLDGIRDMKHQRGYIKLLEHLGVLGTVTGNEVTISNVNGWHPHQHAMPFCKVYQDRICAEEIQAELSKIFVRVMADRGRYVHADIGVNVRTENIVSSYIAKMGEGEKKSPWGLAAEITKSPVKTGRDENHFHPFELLDMVIAKNIDAARLFIEYTKAMKRKNQLRYSPKLRALLGLDVVEKTDQEIAEEIDADGYLFAWVLNYGEVLKHEKRGQLLEVAHTGDYGQFAAYCRVLGIQIRKDE